MPTRKPGRAGGEVLWVLLLLPVMLAIWILLDLLLPPTGPTVIDAITEIRTSPADLGMGSSLHALAAFLITLLMEWAGLALVRRVKSRRNR